MNYFMDWSDYLSTVLRLVDLHDSSHKPGIPTFPPSEERSGLGNGLWLDIAVSLIEYLHENDIEANEGWIYLGEFVDAMQKRHEVAEDDIQYVVSYLATPSRLCTFGTNGVEGQYKVKTTKKTALIERPRHQVADRCRLTPVGRQALQMAKMSSNWLYTKHDAQKIKTAMLSGDFAAILPQAASIAQAVRTFSHEITRLLERPGEQEVWEMYSERAKDYTEAIKDVGNAVIDASDLFVSKEVCEKFDAWLESQKTVEVTQEAINDTLHEIMQSVTSLRRKFSDLITELASKRRNIIGNVRFDKAALWAVFNMPAEKQIELCLSALGPWTIEVSMPSPIDLYGSMRPLLEEDNTRTLVFNEESSQELPVAIHEFLSKYKNDIISSLQQGSLSLSKAIENGWITLDGEIALTELVGVYTSPDWMGSEGNQIGIGFNHGNLKAQLPDGASLRGDELLMFWLDREGE